MIRVFNSIFGHILVGFAFAWLRFAPNLSEMMNRLINEVKLVTESNLNIAPSLANCLVAIEDKRFFEHKGIDVYSIFRAIARNLFFRKLEGASTITQQLVRTLTNRRELTIKRKITEMHLALILEYKFSKNDLMQAYILTYKFNNQTCINTYCQQHGLDIENLSFLDSAVIAARFKYPGLNNNIYKKYLKRVRVIEIMLAKKLGQY